MLLFVITLIMRTTIRNIGNSKGVILPKKLLKLCSIEEEVIIEVKDDAIVIRPENTNKRKGWADAFKKMAERKDDDLEIDDLFEDENLKDWTWK